MLLAEANSARHDGMDRGPPAPPLQARDPGDELADVQALEKAGHARALPRVATLAGAKETVERAAKLTVAHVAFAWT